MQVSVRGRVELHVVAKGAEPVYGGRIKNRQKSYFKNSFESVAMFVKDFVISRVAWCFKKM